MQSAISFGLNTNASVISQQLSTVCSSGNCKWMDFFSLAMCSKCVDITDKISTVRNMSWPMTENWLKENSAAKEEIMTTHSLPNGQTIGNSDISMPDQMGPLELTVKNTARPSESIAFKSTSNLLQAVSILHANFSGKFSQNWTSVPVTASECALYFCINVYHSEIINGTLMEQGTEVPSTPDPASYQAQDPAMDALYEPSHWFPRNDLQILIP